MTADPSNPWETDADRAEADRIADETILGPPEHLRAPSRRRPAREAASHVGQPRGATTGREPVKLGYRFAPIPTRARRARRDGTLSAEGLELLVYLYGEADWDDLALRRESVSRRLDHIAGGMPYHGELDSLRKLIRRLERSPDDWFDVRVKNRSYWVFLLKPDEPERVSDPCPTSEAVACPTSEREEGDQESRPARDQADGLPEFGKAPDGEACPSSSADCPTSDGAADRLTMRSDGLADAPPVRVLQKDQRATTLTKEEGEGEGDALPTRMGLPRLASLGDDDYLEFVTRADARGLITLAERRVLRRLHWTARRASLEACDAVDPVEAAEVAVATGSTLEDGKPEWA